MANLLKKALLGKRSITTIDDYISTLNQFIYNGHTYLLSSAGVQQTLAGEHTEQITNDFVGYARSAWASNGIVFACMLVRMLVFSAVRFQYQRVNQGRLSELFGTRDLEILERPWAGGTTQDLLLQMIQDADLAGNSYWTIAQGEMVRLRPDWVTIVLEPRQVAGGTLGFRRVGYGYYEGGIHAGARPVPLLADQVAHFAPLPDPLATYRGMSWITPVLRELQNDGLMNHHKRKFFENGATPNMVVKLDASVDIDMFRLFKAEMEKQHAGVDNAGKTLYLGGGADATVVGSNFEQMSFKTVQGHQETRIAAAAGVPPVIAGFSEGLQAATYSNYAQARRRFADGTMHPLWQNAAGSLSQIIRPQSGARLWYDARDVPFLREDRKDAADIASTQAQTIRAYIDAGFTPESSVAAVDAEDKGLLEHTGLFSVQLRPANSDTPISDESIPDEDVTGGDA